MSKMLTTKAITFLSGSAGMSLFPLLVHAPLPASIGGLVIAGVLAHKSPEILASLKESLPFSVSTEEDEQETVVQEENTVERTKWDKFLGRKAHPAMPSVHEQPKQEKETAPVVASGKLTNVEEGIDFEVGTVPPLFPVYDEDVTLRLGRVVATGERFDPHFNALIGKGWVAAANQGFGKSILNGVIIERAGRCGLPVIVLDHKGEYHTVKELSFMNALLVGDSGTDYALPIGNGSDELALYADAFIEHVMQGRYQAIISLPSYGSGWLGKATISAAIGQALMRYAEKQRRLGNKLLPCLVIMDEAQLYLPQDQTLLPPEALENKATLSELKNAYFALVSNGRSAGYTLGFATQSLTYLAKWAIKSSQVRIFGRHAEKNDLDMCESIINPLVATRKDIETFPPGVGVVFGLTPQPMIVQFDKKQSRDESETPKMEMLRRPRSVLQEQRVQPRVYVPLPQRSVESDVQPVTPMRPYIVPTQQEREVTQPLHRQVETTGHFTSALTKEQQTALRLYRNGMTYRELAALMTQSGVEIGKDKAGELIKLLKAKKLIA